MQVVTGAFDYDSAMKNACNNLAKRGVTMVQYRNGKPVNLDYRGSRANEHFNGRKSDSQRGDNG